jgi:hypothetical protein
MARYSIRGRSFPELTIFLAFRRWVSRVSTNTRLTWLRRTGIFAALLAFAVHASGPVAMAAPTFTAAQLRADVDALAIALRDMPPDLAHTTDPAKVEEALGELRKKIGTASLDRDAAWRLFATINPLLGDGHLFVGFVDWRADARAHLKSGGRFFPFEMQVSPDCGLSVGRGLGGVADALGGAEVKAIDGTDAHTVCDALMARVHGDTPAFRAALLSRRFWFYYWKIYGAPAAFDIALNDEQAPRHINGSTALPAVLADEESFERQFRLDLLPDKAALLTLSSFAWPDKNQFLDFTRHAFEKMRAAHVKTLIIDVRANGGGNDEMWIDGVMPYLATKPFRWASRFRKRVVVADPAKHEAVGDIVDGEVETWVPPQPDNPLHFAGKLYVLVGSATYSSAVVFSNVVQDFAFGTIAGSGASVRTATTGGTRRTTLPNSGLIVVAPRFVLTRPSGAMNPALLTPDLEVRDLSQLLGAIAPH